MSRIISHRKSGVLQVHIKYGKEVIKFNLWQELRIDEDKLNSELTKQANKYGFLLMLHKKLLTQFEELKVNRKEVFGRLFSEAKKSIVKATGRPMSDDTAKIWVEAHKDYTHITRQCIKAKDDADAIFACVRAFEQRKDLIQSLSSNIRNER